MMVLEKSPINNDMCPLVTLVVPLYNHALYVGQCLESIFSDAYPNKEIVVIDDGSTDGSFQVTRAWYEINRQRFSGRFDLSSRENRGVTRTLNELVSRAAGDFIVVLASDDYLLPGGIQARLDYLRAHPDRMAVIGDCIVIDQNSIKLHDSGLSGFKRGRKAYLVHEKLIAYELVFRWCVPGPVFMARKELYRMIGGYREDIAVEDRDFYLRMIARGLLGFVDYPVAAYRIHTGGFTSTPARELCYKEAMLITVTENLTGFSGLRRFHLLAEKWVLAAELERLSGKESFSDALGRTLSRLLVSLTKRLYTAASPFMARRSGGVK
jgi:glycosyltransferase involved in cell wall biosynthesis